MTRSRERGVSGFGPLVLAVLAVLPWSHAGTSRSSLADRLDTIVPEGLIAPERPTHETERRVGAVWDLDVGPSFERVDRLGRALSHLRPGLHEGIDELNGNLLQKYGPLYMNTLAHNDFEGGETVARLVQQRDKFLYGSPGIFNLGIFDVFLFDEAVDDDTATETVTGYQGPVQLVTEDRTVVTFRPSGDLDRGDADPNGMVPDPFMGARLSYRYGDAVQVLTFDDGTRYELTRLVHDDPSSPCDLDWNERRLIYHDTDGSVNRFLDRARDGKNRIYALTKVVDRFGNETLVERQVGYADSLHCRVTRVLEREVGPSGALVDSHVTDFAYGDIEVEGARFFPLTRVTFLAGSGDEKVYTFTYHEYPDHRWRHPPHLISMTFGADPTDLDETMVRCFQYIFPHRDGLLRSTEGPYRARLREPAAEHGYCHPSPPSTAVGGAQLPVGPVDVFTLDMNGRLREWIRPDGTGLELWFNPDAPELTLSYTWPFRRPAVPGRYERDEHTDAPAVRQSQIAASLRVEHDPATNRPQVAQRWDNFGRYWIYARDDRGRVVTTESHDGQRTVVEYERDDPDSPFRALDRPLAFRVTDAHGAATTHRYDGLGRLVETSSNAGATVATWSYFDEGPLFGQLRQHTRTGVDPLTGDRVREETSFYEPGATGGAGVPRTGPIVIRESFSSQSPYGGAPSSVASTLVLDAGGRPIAYTNPAGRTEHVDYSGRGETFRVTEADGSERMVGQLTRRASHAPAHVVDAHGVETRIEYTGTGQLRSVRSEAGAWSAEFDDHFQFVRARTAPEAGAPADQAVVAEVRTEGACGQPVSIATGVGAGVEPTTIFEYEPPDGGHCGVAEVGASCGDDEWTPVECGSLSNPRTRRVFCRDEFGCGQCPIAYSDDRYCIGGFCGGSCTMFPVSVCADGTRIPTCPSSPPP